MTILRRAAPTRWLYPAILLLLFMEKSSALEIAGYGGSASWTQISFMDPYDGGKAGAPGGILSFSQDGSRLLMGWPGLSWDSCDDVAVYEWQSGVGFSVGTRIGDIIPKLGSRVIHSASLSGDGNVVALGDGDDDSGSESVWTARVFHYSGGSWQQVGSDIVGPLTEGARNVKVSISSDGKVLSVGNSESDPSDYNATLTGRVRIYQWPSNDLAAADTWTQMGETIEAFGGTAEGTVNDVPYKRDVYMDAGTLSGDGTRVAVFRDDSYVGTGHVYEWKSSTWSLVGDGIYLGGEASLSNDGTVVAGLYGSSYKELGSGAWSWLSSAYSGYEVSLSSDGTRVASGETYDNSDAGIVVIQEWDSDAEKWMTMVQIPGISADDRAGSTVSLSGDGSRVAVYSQGAGHVRVFEMTGTTCDTSTAPSNAAVGNCPSTLAFGSSCQPECDTGYAATSPTTTCGVSGILKSSVCEEACDVSSAPANGGKGDCGDFLLAGYDASCTPTCDDGYVLKGGNKTTCSDDVVLDAAECRKRYSWGDEKFCPKWEDRVFCFNAKTESDCDAARSCLWSSDGSGSCSHDDDGWNDMTGESYSEFGGEACDDHDIWHAANHGDFEEAAALLQRPIKL